MHRCFTLCSKKHIWQKVKGAQREKSLSVWVKIKSIYIYLTLSSKQFIYILRHVQKNIYILRFVLKNKCVASSFSLIFNPFSCIFQVFQFLANIHATCASISALWNQIFLSPAGAVLSISLLGLFAALSCVIDLKREADVAANPAERIRQSTLSNPTPLHSTSIFDMILPLWRYNYLAVILVHVVFCWCSSV